MRRGSPWHLGSQRGSAYLVVMFAVVVMSISITAAAKQWKTVVQREKEADLLVRGIEIQTAIGFYSKARQVGSTIPGEKYPLTLEELTKGPKPFLRKVYKDPITGQDWEYIREAETGRIKGVRSRAKLAPIKQHQFPPAVAYFEGLTQYHDWVFEYPSASMLQTPQALPGQQPQGAPGTPSNPPGSNSPPPPGSPPPVDKLAP
jgi:type II secretory pathway pseudopilin PulG